jgi:hypothetical protein
LRERAFFFFSQKQYPEALETVSLLLEHHPKSAKSFFATIGSLIENGQPGKEWLATLKPAWFASFSAYVCEKTTRPQRWIVPFLEWHATHGQTARLDISDSACLVDTLITQKYYREAYQYWLAIHPSTNGVPWLSNGGFEGAPTGAAFDWKIATDRRSDIGFEASFAKTPGATGTNALVVNYTGRKLKANVIRQYVSLDAGEYTLAGRGMPMSLKSIQGVRWVVRCIASGALEGKLLGATVRQLGSGDWQALKATVVVPAECPIQLVLLETTSPNEAASGISGKIVFDDLSLQKK